MLRILALASIVSLLAGSAQAQSNRDVCDWHDLDRVRTHVSEAIGEISRARAANHYDMDGHGAKAEDLLKQSLDQLARAVESAKANGNGHCHR